MNSIPVSFCLGHGLGNIGYVRDREKEFTQKNIPLRELLEMTEDTIQMLTKVLQEIDPDTLDENFPMVIWDKPMSANYTLIQLALHLNYHLGQINYHRRLLDH